VPRLELVERLSADLSSQRWLVRAEGHAEPRVAWMFFDDDRAFLEMSEERTRMWLGPLHPRISQIFEIAWLGEALAFVVDDDRGPRFAEAAAQLADPVDRERWCVAQIIALGDGLATMRQRARDFVHRHLEPGQLFVDPSGHARLRAPIALITQEQRQGYMGRGPAIPRTTLAAMSPEQCRGYQLTHASDVFALAGNLVAALTGRSPFRRDDDFATLQAIISDPPPPLVTHAPGLGDVIVRGLEKDPAKRYPDPGTFAGELWRCVPDAAEYDECISDVLAAWWPTATPAADPPPQAGERCRMAWDQLRPTDSESVRHCGSCGQDVVRVASIGAAIALAGRRCVAYDGGG
jgi:hypothetical protein